MLGSGWIKPCITTSAILIIGIFLSSSIWAADTVAAQIAHGPLINATSARTAVATSSNITIGSPEFIGKEYDKTISLKPVSINGTHRLLIVFVGNGSSTV